MRNRIAVLVLTLVPGSALPPTTSVLFAQGLGDLGPPLSVSESVCTRFVELADNKRGVAATPLSPTAAHALQSARLTDYVANALPPLPGGGRTGISQNLANAGLIDQFIFGALQDAGVQPADPTTDWEFIRRITLDLTGRIPDPSRVLSFVASTDPNKRTALVDELIARPEWLDKWTMFFGDLYKNNSSNSQIQRFRPGVQAFHDYIRTSLLSGKPYDQMSRDLIKSAIPQQQGFTDAWSTRVRDLEVCEKKDAIPWLAPFLLCAPQSQVVKVAPAVVAEQAVQVRDSQKYIHDHVRRLAR
jgi:hypothetical protein